MKIFLVFFRFFLSLLLFSTTCIKASHVFGGEISYTWIAGNTYELKLTYYRDCGGTSLPQNQQINISSSTCNVQMATTLSAAVGTPSEIPYICPTVNNTCNGGVAPGVEIWVYSGIVTLPSNCPDYIFSFTDCCRPGYLPNIEDDGYFEATLDNFNVAYNNSVQYTSNPIMFLIPGNHYTINNGCFDPDGDSLVYSLAAARKDSSTIIQYYPTFSYQSPFSSSTPINLDPVSGDFEITTLYQEASAVVFQIKEYRNGVLVGTSARDIRIFILNDTNTPPTLSGINNSSYFSTSACAGDTVRFKIYSNDFDITDTTQIQWSSVGLAPFSLNSSGGIRDSISIELITDSTMISNSPYQVRLTVKDNHCPSTAYQSYSYQVYVNGCSSNIWPGDANADLTCNLYDVFPIGLAYGFNGPVRSGATINWAPEINSNWSQNFNFNVNFKHADCNGDGSVDNNDLDAIAQNFGLTHPLRYSNPNITSASDFTILRANQDSVVSGDTVVVEIKLGDSINPINNIYGVAFELNFDPSILDSLDNPLEFIQSPFGTPGVDLLSFIKTEWQQGKIYAAAVRTDQNNSSSDSVIALFKVKIKNSIPVNSISILYLTGLRGVDANDSTHTVNGIGDTLYINTSTVGKQTITEIFDIDIYPNPAQDALFISAPNKLGISILILDISGRIVSETMSESLITKVDISNLSKGVYSVGIKTDENLIWKKLVVSR